jgi:3-isopropylmalate dehydrogenase
MPGDGIGPEQTQATLLILDAIKEKLGINFEILEIEGGDGTLRKRGVALPDETIETIKASDACLKGPVGETAADVIVKLRLMFDLYVNLRPIKAYPNVPSIRQDIDMVIVRENTEDLYKGLEFKIDENTAIAQRVITREGSQRIAEYAFQLAEKRRKKVTSVHKSNVMKITCGLFAQTCRDVSKKHPTIAFEELYVDAAAMDLIRRPHEFDVIVTTNMFGDILSDEAAQLVGGLGMAPGGNIGRDFALFEPIHGCAPTIAGKQLANPCSMILAASLMFNWLGERNNDRRCVLAAEKIERAVIKTLEERLLTADLGGKVKTQQMGKFIAEKIM